MRVLLATALLVAQAALPPGQRFQGHWTADVAASRFNPGVVVKAATLDFAVTSETVSITDGITDGSGREIGTGTTVFRTDGKVYPHEQLLSGLTVVCQWKGPSLLDTVLTRRNGIVDHVTYEVSEDGETLTLRTQGPLGSQTILYRRD
jgi:hypothetical protein